MRARIHQECSNGLYWGQIFNEKYKCWEDVTLSCFTEHGARKALEKWRKENRPQEFEI